MVHRPGFKSQDFVFVFQGNKTAKKRYIPDDFHIDPDFKRLVSYNTTAVHIPTDIYEGCKLKHTYTCIVAKFIISYHLHLPLL